MSLPLLLAACSSMVVPGAAAFAQTPRTEAPSWGFFAYTPDLRSELANARLSRVTSVVWTAVEPVPGSGIYAWGPLDNRVKGAQTAGTNVVLVLKTGNGSSFSEPGCFRNVEAAAAAGKLPNGRYLSSCPIGPEMEGAWSRMVTELVERYDGDGIRDMRNLVGSLRVDIEVENEASSPDFWDYGASDRVVAADRYLRLLELSYRAKEVANPQTQVILTGLAHPNLLARCDGQPDAKECSPFILQSLTFAKRILARPDIFDAIDVHLFAYYHFEPQFVDDALQWIVAQMQQGGYQRPLYALEWNGASMLHVTEGYRAEFRRYFPYSADFPSHQAFEEMYVALDQPANVTYRRWFEAEQAKEFGKLFTNILAHGVSRLVHVQYSDYRGSGWNNSYWNWQGLIKYVDGAPVRKPSYYAYNTLSQAISGFTAARRIEHGNVRLYEFTFPTGEPTYVLWTDGASETVDLSSVIARGTVRITHLVTELDAANAPIVPSELTVAATAVPAGDVPVLLKGVQ